MKPYTDWERDKPELYSNMLEEEFCRNFFKKVIAKTSNYGILK